MNCEKCQDRGFTEENHGLRAIFCDCEAGKEYRAKMEAILGIPKEVVDDSNSGTGSDNSDTGSDNPSKPKQPSKRKARRKTAKKSG